jgi:hypothetical protein
MPRHVPGRRGLSARVPFEAPLSCDGLLRVPGASRLGYYHYIPVLCTEGRQKAHSALAVQYAHEYRPERKTCSRQEHCLSAYAAG